MFQEDGVGTKLETSLSVAPNENRVAASRNTQFLHTCHRESLATFFSLLLAGPAAAQRPTAKATKPPADFWSVDATTGMVVLRSLTAGPLVSALTQTEHLRAWLTGTCSTWGEQ